MVRLLYSPPMNNPFWLIWLVVGIAYEIWAIVTNKDDTLSERVWWWIARHPITRVLVGLFLIWAFFHIVWGPCAFGIC